MSLAVWFLMVSLFLWWQFRWYARDRGGLTAENALQMALGTLDGMAKGGIRDHLGKPATIYLSIYIYIAV